MDKYLKKLLTICEETYEIAYKTNDNLEVNLRKDNHFMCKSFLNRQLSQMKSLLMLSDSDDLILIARSMFEGSLYLFYSIKTEEMCYRWRIFSVLIDKQRFDKARENNEQVPLEVENFINNNIEEIDRLFKKNNGQYEYKWYGSQTIKKIAEDSDEFLLHLYTNYYSEMSEYHHWDTASFGKRNQIVDNKLKPTNSDEVKLERANAICMAVSSLFSSLKLSCQVTNYDINDKLLKELESKLKTIEGTISTEIHITRQSSQ